MIARFQLWVKVFDPFSLNNTPPAHSHSRYIAQKLRMKSARQNSLSRVPPSNLESCVVHSLFVKHQIPDSDPDMHKPGHTGTTMNAKELEKVPMSETALENTSLTHPQERKYDNCPLFSSLSSTHLFHT